MKQYLDLVKDVLENGIYADDRTGVGTYSVLGRQMRFNLQNDFPLCTTKKVHMKSIIHELVWFLSGNINTKYLKDNGVKIWDGFEDAKGDVWPSYGHYWRNWCDDVESVDQVGRVIEQIKTNPNSRRMMILSYNPLHITETSTPVGCHFSMEFYCKNNKLSLHLYQRSADLALGLPFNIASYSLLLMMMAQVTNTQPHELVHTIGNAHIYTNHVDGLREQVLREPLPLPTMILNPEIKDIDDFKYSDFTLENYQSHPSIKFALAI